MLCSCSLLDIAHSQTQQVLWTLLGSGALGSRAAARVSNRLLAILFPTFMSHPISTARCPKVFLITSTSNLYITKKQTWPLRCNILVNITLDLNSFPLSYSSLKHRFSLCQFVKQGSHTHFKLMINRMLSIYRQCKGGIYMYSSQIGCFIFNLYSNTN